MFKRWIMCAREMGPAWIINTIACGPATLGSVWIAGASYGFALLWLVIVNAVFWARAQYPAARMGITEGRGIIATLSYRLHF